MRSLVLWGLARRKGAAFGGCDLTVHGKYAQARFLMNHLNDRDPESHRGESSKRLKLLEALIDKAIKKLKDKKTKNKVQLVQYVQ